MNKGTRDSVFSTSLPLPWEHNTTQGRPLTSPTPTTDLDDPGHLVEVDSVLDVVHEVG